jgi:MFS family permease
MRITPERINPSLLAILAEGFSSRLSFGLVSFALPLYAYHLGLNLTGIGLLASLNLIVEQAFKPLMGWAADRVGLKRSFTAAVALRTVVALLLAFASAPWQLFAIRILHGLAESLRDPSVNSLLVDTATTRNTASYFAWYSTAKTVAGSLGKTAAGLLLTVTAYNYSRVFLVAFVLSGLPLYVVARYARERDPLDHAGREQHSDTPATREAPETGNTTVAVPGRVAILPMAILGFLIAATANMMSSLFPVLAKEYAGLSAAETGLIYSISIAVVIVSGPLFGWLSDNVSRKLVLMVRGISNTVSSVLFMIFPSFAGIAIGKAVDDLGKSAYRPAWGAVMARVSGFDRQRRARTIGYLSMGEGIGETLGPVLAGLLWNIWGVGVMLGARVLLAAISEVYTIIITRKMDTDGVQARRLVGPLVRDRLDDRDGPPW